MRDSQRPTYARDVIAITSACDSILADGILGLGYVLATTTADSGPARSHRAHFANIRLTPLPFYDTDKAPAATPTGASMAPGGVNARHSRQRI